MYQSTYTLVNSVRKMQAARAKQISDIFITADPLSSSLFLAACPDNLQALFIAMTAGVVGWVGSLHFQQDDFALPICLDTFYCLGLM